MPVEFTAWHCSVGDELLQAEVHRANNFISDLIFIEKLEQKTVRGQGPLNREPKLLLNRANVVFCGNSLGANLLSIEFCNNISVDRSHEVHLRQFLRLDETDLELFEFLLNLSGHEDDLIGRFRATLVVQLDLLVTRTLDSDANLEVAGDFREVFALRVEKSDPLMQNSMLWLKVYGGHIELVGAYQLISENALVHHFDRDRFHLDFA